MPTPMNHANCVRLTGLTAGSVGERLRAFFARSPRGMTGSYIDREKGWLLDEGAPATGSRADMWRKVVGGTSTTPVFTDGMSALAVMPRSAYPFTFTTNVYADVGVGSTYAKA